MKKRLLSILLSLAMVLTMIPFATMTAFAGEDETKTVEDILKTVGDFPTSATGAWEGEEDGDNKGAKLYINETKKVLFFENDTNSNSVSYFVPLDSVCTSKENTYEWRSTDDSTAFNLNGYKVEFKMSEGVVNRIKLTGGVQPMISQKDIIGEYTAPKSSFDWSKLAKGVGIAAGITAATVGTIHTVKAIKNYKAEKAKEEAERKAAEAEAKRIAELEAAKALVEGTALTQNKLVLTEKGSIKVSFNAADLDGVLGYEVERATDKTFTKNVKTYNTVNTTLTNSKNLKKGTKYYYRVRAKVELTDGSIVYTDWSNTRYAKATKTR